MKVVIGIVAVLIAITAIYLIDVDQTKELYLPTVDVDVNEGQMPNFDIDVADVSIGSTEVTLSRPNVDVETKTIEIEVPVDVDANMKDTSFTLPTIEVEKPKEDNPADTKD